MCNIGQNFPCVSYFHILLLFSFQNMSPYCTQHHMCIYLWMCNMTTWQHNIYSEEKYKTIFWLTNQTINHHTKIKFMKELKFEPSIFLNTKPSNKFNIYIKRLNLPLPWTCKYNQYLSSTLIKNFNKLWWRSLCYWTEVCKRSLLIIFHCNSWFLER